MAMVPLDATGLKCPQPVLRIAAKSVEMNTGDIMEVTADCPTFEKDVRSWAERVGKVVLAVRDEGSGKLKIQIQF